MNEKINTDKTIDFKKIILGIQFLFVAFGAVVLVPLLIGIDPAVALFTAGLGTLLFHFITKLKVPVFLGSSFVFISPIILATKLYGYSGALSGLFCVGILFVIMSIIVQKVGIIKVKSIFPNIVIGPVIMTIGLSLASTGVEMAQTNWLLAFIALITAIIVVAFSKGIFKLLPVISGVVVGYIVALFMGQVDFSLVTNANWFSVPQFVFPTFSIGAIILFLPVAIAPIIEHIGDIYAISKVAKKDFTKNPGIHKTLVGDGLATSLAALFGGPPNTTYSEITGAISLTKLTNPIILRISAITAIIFAFVGKISGLLETIPQAILGGVMLLLFGMISIVGIKTLMDNKNNCDLSKTRNQIIVAIILSIGVGGAIINYGTFSLGGIGLASLCGVILHLVLPK
jgi:uracil permease